MNNIRKIVLQHLEQAETLIDNNRVEFARAFICELPECQYEVMLAWSLNEALGYRYFLSRYVLEKIEPPSRYTRKDGVSQDLAIFKSQLLLIRSIPSDVMSKPLKIDKPKKKKDKSKTLTLAFL